ncbi:MAG: 30S ribosomal protein S2 [Candidatus Brocadiia bacterium]
MEKLTIRELIKAGFHFGHRTSRWNPKMEPYIFKRRNLIHIIDLRETLRGLIVGRRLSKAVAAQGKYVLFGGTKKQARKLVEREATRCGMPYVAERWPGGLLTNYVTIRKRLDRLEELEELETSGQINLYSKKMVSSLRREKRKILRNLGGVRDMDRLPGLLVLVDPAREHIAVREAVKLEIPIIALTDTDGSPDDLDVVVPGNDDSIAAIEIFLNTISDAIREAKLEAGQPLPEETEPAAAVIAEEQEEAAAEEGGAAEQEAETEGEAGEAEQEAEPVEASADAEGDEGTEADESAPADEPAAAEQPNAETEQPVEDQG